MEWLIKKRYGQRLKDKRCLAAARIDYSGSLRAVTFIAAGPADMGFAYGSNKHGGLSLWNVFTVLWNNVITNRHQTSRARVRKLMKAQQAERQSDRILVLRVHFEDCDLTVSACLQPAG